MADRYGRSTDGSNADNGTTWPLAKLDCVGLAAIDTVGDRLFLSHVHAETTAGSITFSFAGTLAAPTKLLCGNDAAEPPTALATTATVTTTTTNANISINGSAYVYGVTFSAGTSTANAFIVQGQANQWQRYENCQFFIGGTGGTAAIAINATGVAGNRVDWKNCNIKFAAAGQTILVQGRFHWNGGSVVAGGTNINALLSSNYGTPSGIGTALIENVDLSNLSATLNLAGPPPASSPVIFRNCKLPASWSGSPINTAFTMPGRVEVYNCDSGSTNYKLWIEDYSGSIRDETTILKAGGASDGTTALAWKMVSLANCQYPSQPLASPEIVFWNDVTAVAKTVTVDIIRDSATNLTNAEVWVEISYLGTSGFPVGTSVNDCVADVLTAPADQDASSATWTTTGMANPNTQKLVVTFTPQMRGFFIAKVMLAKASTTVFIDPKLIVT